MNDLKKSQKDARTNKDTRSAGERKGEGSVDKEMENQFVNVHIKATLLHQLNSSKWISKTFSRQHKSSTHWVVCAHILQMYRISK